MIPEPKKQFSKLADEGRIGRWTNAQSQVAWPAFGEDELDFLIESDGASLGHYRFMKQGVTIDPNLMKLLDAEDRLIPERVNLLKNQGITIIASRLEFKLTSVRNLAQQLQAATGCYVRAVGIASFGSVCGMPRHFDHVDVFVLQTVGEKRWRFFGDPIRGAGVARKIKEEPEEQSASLNMLKGSQLFVPAGIFHQCDPAQLSFHIAFNLKWPCALDLLGLQYEPEKSYSYALLEPIRWFAQRDRLSAIVARFGPLLEEYGYSGNLEADLRDWPARFERAFAFRGWEQGR